jgi:hypothetical protein
MIMNKKLIAAVAALTLALPLVLTGPASAAPVHLDRPTPLTCEIKASPVRVFRDSTLIQWEAVVAKKHSRDGVLIWIADSTSRLKAFTGQVPASAKGAILVTNPSGNRRGVDVFSIQALDPATHQTCAATVVVKVHR